MKWQDFIDERKVKRTNKDVSKIKSLIKMSDNLIISLSRMKIDYINSSMILSNYYEALRQIVESISILHGFIVYSHEAFTSFLSEVLHDNILAKKFDRFRKMRNGVNYYGKNIDLETAKDAADEIPLLIKRLKDSYLDELI